MHRTRREVSNPNVVHDIDVLASRIVDRLSQHPTMLTTENITKFLREHFGTLTTPDYTESDIARPVRLYLGDKEDEPVDACGFEYSENEEGERLIVCPTCSRCTGKEVQMKGGRALHFTRRILSMHLLSMRHKKSVDFENERMSEGDRMVVVGVNMCKLVLQTIREGGSYLGFEKKIVDFQLMGGRVGRFNHSKRFISQMVECMYDECMHRIKT